MGLVILVSFLIGHVFTNAQLYGERITDALYGIKHIKVHAKSEEAQFTNDKKKEYLETMFKTQQKHKNAKSDIYAYYNHRPYTLDFQFNTLPPDKRIIIPDLGIQAPIVTVEGDIGSKMKDGEFTEELKQGAVWYPTTPSPEEKGTTMIVGHTSNYFWIKSAYNTVFSKIPYLKEGQKIQLIRNGKMYEYIMKDEKIIKPDQVDDIYKAHYDENNKRLAIMGCYPIGTRDKRIVIFAEPVKQQKTNTTVAYHSTKAMSKTNTQSLQIIKEYQTFFGFFKKYFYAVSGTCLALVYIFILFGSTTDSSVASEIRLYTQSGNTITTHGIYIPNDDINLAQFKGHIIGGSFSNNGSYYISNNNLLSIHSISLPRLFTTPIQNDYMVGGPKEQVESYIENFITINTGLLTESISGSSAIILPKISLRKEFKLDCLYSPLTLQHDFCDYNVEEFAANAYKFDLSNSFTELNDISNHISNTETRNNLCQSIIKYLMVTNTNDMRFSTLLSSCDNDTISTYKKIQDRNAINTQLLKKLNEDIPQENSRNQYKLASSMQVLASQINNNSIDIGFLQSYYSYIYAYLQHQNTDTFSINLIYKFNNSYLLPGLTKLLKVVNVDTSIDIQNIIDKLDTLNNGDSLNLIGLRFRISPEVASEDDYASTHLPLDANSAIHISGSQNTGVDAQVINTLIGAVDISINNTMHGNSSGIDAIPNTKETPINGSTPSGTIPDTQSGAMGANESGAQPNKTYSEEDLNTYQPKSTKPINTYDPTASLSREKAIVSDRMFNHLGIKPITIISKSGKYFIEWEYKSFSFSALLDPDNDRKLGPMYVKIEGSRRIVPDLELYLMDYDRYSQVKFLKNPELYVRQAGQQ